MQEEPLCWQYAFMITTAVCQHVSWCVSICQQTILDGGTCIFVNGHDAIVTAGNSVTEGCGLL